MIVSAVQRRAKGDGCHRGQSLRKGGGKCTGALNMEKVAPDRDHDTESQGVVKDKDEHFAGADVDDEVLDAVYKTPKCKKKRREAMRYCNRWRSADV